MLTAPCFAIPLSHADISKKMAAKESGEFILNDIVAGMGPSLVQAEYKINFGTLSNGINIPIRVVPLRTQKVTFTGAELRLEVGNVNPKEIVWFARKGEAANFVVILRNGAIESARPALRNDLHKDEWNDRQLKSGGSSKPLRP